MPVDSSRIALAGQAAALVGVGRKDDLAAALEATLVCREQDRAVFAELFEAFFRDPDVAAKLLAQMLPRSPGTAEPARRPRVREALSPPRPPSAAGQPRKDQGVDLDAAMTASEQDRLRHADFNALGATEYRLVERLAREISLAIPEVRTRRTRAGGRGRRPHWARTLREAGRSGGELLRLLQRRRRTAPLPLLVLVDVSGSMERYARLLLAFLHAATRGAAARGVCLRHPPERPGSGVSPGRHRPHAGRRRRRDRRLRRRHAAGRVAGRAAACGTAAASLAAARWCC